MKARSEAELFNKLSITVEEADETGMWIDPTIISKMIESKEIKKELHEESLNLVKILTSTRKRL